MKEKHITIKTANTKSELEECFRLREEVFIIEQSVPVDMERDEHDATALHVFPSEHKLKLNGSSISLKYCGPAHNDGDISVTFGEADILHAADTYWNGIYPFIDYSTGGGIDGMIAASDANLAATTDKTIFIPGHGKPVSNRAELKEFRDMLVAIRENVAALKKQGRSRDETLAAKPTAAFDAKCGNFVIDPGFFTRLVYEGV
jgi:glyoxylase-like metal-dependent hydrolase (beta-lactamase superfamily II)